MMLIRRTEALYYRRRKDIGTKKGGYIDALLKEDNPFRKMMPNVSVLSSARRNYSSSAVRNFGLNKATQRDGRRHLLHHRLH